MEPEFEAELLAFALDGGTVRHLAAVAAERWGLPADDVLRAVRAALDRGELRLSLDDGAGTSREVSARELTAALLAEQPYVWLAPTSRTFERLAVLGRT
jgi:hypothetical protein